MDEYEPLEPQTASPAAGSSKPRKERKERVNTTVFVSSLPYEATSTDLTTHFSFIGPVRFGFVATDKDTGKSKGVGYVTYALLEDAEKAVAELDGGEFGAKGRKIRVSWADKKPPPPPRDGSAAVPVEKKVVKTLPSLDTTDIPTDPNAIRTVIISGLPAGIEKNVLWKKVRKTGDCELVFPIEGAPDTAHCIYHSHGDAFKALGKLHGHTYKGALLSAALKKRVEALAKKGEGATSHAGRLIIRNLSWDTTVQDLRKAFLKFGPIHSIDLPTLPSILPPSADKNKPPPPPRARGFAFVWFLIKKDAERAMEAVNGTVIKPPPEGKEGRPVAVDWALSKEKWEEEGKKKEEEKEESASGSGEESEEEDESEPDSDVEMAVPGDDDEEEDDEEEDDEDDEDNTAPEEPVKPALPAVQTGNTVFVRNLPFEATEEELTQLFRAFGPLRYARITMDKATGRSRGTGFVCFWNNEHADQVINEAELISRETGANAMPLGAPVRNPFALPSILTVDPSANLAQRLTIHGRVLDVSRAVTREEASTMKEDGERAREKADKRNTYLMREGVIFPGSSAASTLPEAEIEKRLAEFTQRKQLLRTNPSLYISKTRLSVRHLPLTATDRTLKRLAIHATREFEAEVKRGEREPLSRTESLDDTLSPAIAAREANGIKGKPRKFGNSFKERITVVVQSKLVRQTEKVDPLTGLGKSKGYGFLEMRTHKDALRVLRWANNNPVVGPLMNDWFKQELEEMTEKVAKSLEAARAAGTEHKGESVDALELRLKKLKARTQETGADKAAMKGKTLFIDFSVENVQVVKRRVEKTVTASTNSKRKALEAAEDSEDDEPRQPSKRPRDQRDDRYKNERPPGPPGGKPRPPAPTPAPVAAAPAPAKPAAGLGSLIGRKRKMRKGK